MYNRTLMDDLKIKKKVKIVPNNRKRKKNERLKGHIITFLHSVQ